MCTVPCFLILPPLRLPPNPSSLLRMRTMLHCAAVLRHNTSLTGQAETAEVSTSARAELPNRHPIQCDMAEYTASSRRKTSGSVTPECIQELLDFFIKSAYKAKNVDQRVCTTCTHSLGG